MGQGRCWDEHHSPFGLVQNVFPTGIIKIPRLRESNKQCKSMVDLSDLPMIVHCLGWCRSDRMLQVIL